MNWRVGKPLKVFTRGTSLRRRVAYSLAMVRLILVPVIFLAVYYLFSMGWIVDRIVNVDAPVASLAQRASIEMLDARRAERNYFLLHDPEDLEANGRSLSRLERLLATCYELQPEEGATVQKIQAQTHLYRQRLSEAAEQMGEPAPAPFQRVQEVVRAYEKDLNGLLQRARRQSRARLIEELRSQVGSFDTQITATLEAEDPAFRRITLDLRTSSGEVLSLASDLEKRSWERVQRDHQEARILVRRAEWVLGIISGFTLLLSVWVSFVLPRQVVIPLADLKAAVDHAAAGNYEIEFDVQGEGEVAQLANSVRSLIAHLREKEANTGLATAP